MILRTDRRRLSIPLRQGITTVSPDSVLPTNTQIDLMASSNSPRDNGAENDSKKPSENPFVKFKRTVDDHVSSVLQGIVGLPSILTRHPNDANARWAEVDADLQRRQEAVGRKPSERLARSYNSERVSDEEEVEIHVKKFSEQPSGSDSSREQPTYAGENYDDYDLYSSFGKREIDRLNAVPPGDPWLQDEAGEDFTWRPDSTGTIIEGVQQRFRASLHDVAGKFATKKIDCDMTSEKTLVPYLLFSPYSPLALTHLPPLQPRISDWEYDHDDEFTYCDAFEDLLQTSRDAAVRTELTSSSPWPKEYWPPKNMMTSFSQWVNPLGSWRRTQFNLFSNDDLAENCTLADYGIAWASSLGQKTLLYEDPYSIFGISVVETEFGHALAPKPPIVLLTLLNYADAMRRYGNDGLPQTEQDMYDRFLLSKSKESNDQEKFGGTLIELLSVLAGAGRVLSDVFRGIDSENQNAPSMKTISTDTQTEIIDSHGHRTSTESSDEKFPESFFEDLTDNMEIRKDPTSTSDTDRVMGNVISLTTSKEQVRMEDGTVKTIITIEKIFEDGKKQVTRTTQIQSPSWDTQEGGTHDDSRKFDEGNDGNDTKDKGVKGKGWFWKRT
jgi:hypothetical protein